MLRACGLIGSEICVLTREPCLAQADFMSEINPYAPPETTLIPPPLPPEDAPLASPWRRLGGAFLDGLAVMLASIPVAWVLEKLGVHTNAFSSGPNGFSFRLEGFVGTTISFLVWMLINWSHLARGETLGKRLLGMKVVRKDGRPIPRANIITDRTLPVYLVSIVPGVGSLFVLIDCLLIFRSGRNTLHDDLAKTKVIKVR